MKNYLRAFLEEKPFFFLLLRPKEAALYQSYKPFVKPVLDVGCGDGFFAKVAFGKIDVGIDPDKQAITEAKTRNVYKEVHVYDGKNIPYPNNYFMTIVCNSTFEHITNLPQVLSETSRVLKKGGMLYFTVPTDIWPTYLFGRLLFGKWYEKYFIDKSKHYNLYTVKQWQQKLKQLNLDVVYSTHYLDSKFVMWLFDISHYLSISSLLTKKLFNRWVLFPGKTILFRPFESMLIKVVEKNTTKGPYLFIVAKKTR